MTRPGPMRLAHGPIRILHSATFQGGTFSRARCPFRHGPETGGSGRDCTREVSLLLCHPGCFEAGRFTQTQSSWTASCRSRKWMSGHAEADALTQFATDLKKQVVQQLVEPTTALQETLPSAGEVLFSLDKPLSWMSRFPLPRLANLRRPRRDAIAGDGLDCAVGLEGEDVGYAAGAGNGWHNRLDTGSVAGV